MASPQQLPGVYAIRCTVNGRAYIGSSKDVHGRWREHQASLVAGKSSLKLQAAWNKYGAAAWTWAILEVVIGPKEALVAREQFYIDREARPYNMAKRAGSGPRDGFKHRPESIEKMRAVAMGHPVSVATRRKLSEWRNGRPNPEQSARMKGVPKSDEFKARMSVAQKGRVKSLEERAKLSASLKGRTFSPAHCAKISAVKKGQPHWSKRQRQDPSALSPQAHAQVALADSTASGASAVALADSPPHPASGLSRVHSPLNNCKGQAYGETHHESQLVV